MSMSQYICVICTRLIPASVIAARHYSTGKPMPPIEEMVCSRECSDKLRARKGLYKQMSMAGKGARSVAVAASNKVNPRRKKG